MQEKFVVFLVVGVVFAVFAALCAIGAAAATKKRDKSGNAITGVACVVVAGLCLSFSWYTAGQLNKMLPNLRAHGCVQSTYLKYKLGEGYHTDVNQLIRAHDNSGCKGSIVVQYQDSQPITIPLK